MIFETQYCIPTEFLTEETFNLLVDKIVLQGYNLPTVYMKEFDNWSAFNWIGVNSYDCVLLYSNNEYYLSTDEFALNNTLSDI